MIKNSEKFGLILLLCLSLTNLSGHPAFADNTLSQVDIRKNSTDGLEFTLYTSSPYADNVVVTKKSDNKYVILMPNVNSASGSKPDLSSVKDLVSDIDVKAVNDSTGGYTKVTVTTSRPVDIKTTTAKSIPLTEGQREYRALIAQKKITSDTTAQTIPEQTAPPQQKTSGFKLPEIQPTKTAADIVATTTAATTTATPVQTVKNSTDTKPAVEKKQAAPAVKPSNTQQKQDTTVKKISAPKTETIKPEQKIETKPVETKNDSTVKTTVKSPEKTPATAQTNTVKSAETQKIANNANNIQQTDNKLAEQEKTTEVSKDLGVSISSLLHKLAGKMPENMPVVLVLIFVPLICLLVLFNLIKNSILRSQALKKSFLDGISKGKKPIQNYDNIINNESLSWQEKYQQYMDASGEKDKAEATEKYTVVTTPQTQEKTLTTPEAKNNKKEKQQNEPKIQPETKSQPELQKKNKQSRPEPKAAQSKFVTESRLERLERMIQASPNIEKTEIANDIEETEKLSPISKTIISNEAAVSENDSIHENLKSVKFKAFAEKIALEETNRNKKIKHRRIQIELPKEGPHVNLGYSQLHTNQRLFKNANLSVSDLIATSNKILNINPEFTENKNDYEMISVDDYFNIIENDKAKVTSSLSDVVANSLANIKPDLPAIPRISKNVTNPITKTQKETKDDYLSGLIVKSGFNIDENRGFYLVSLDGKSAIIGRIGEEVFILKKFDRNINKPLQVRMDNPNVYMVKADDFKSLVEVGKDNMGVLIEL